ncbi:MAG: hypothetical protein ACRC11_15125, partial [Xenococcaceae cyanobacterium]
ESNMSEVSPKYIYHNLRLLDRVDIVTSATYRQQAQEILANPEISQTWKMAIANRLYQANRQLEMMAAGSEDSY